MTQTIEEIIAERDMLKGIVAKQMKTNQSLKTGEPHIRFYFNVMGEIVYGYYYRIPGYKGFLNRMGYDTLLKAKKALEIAIASEANKKRRQD